MYSSLTGTFGGVIKNGGSTRSYPFSYSIPVANTWTAISITIAGDTSGTWLTTNGIGISIVFGMGVGSTASGTAGAWAGANYVSATGATSVVGTNGATWYITGVQLEKGSTATSFDYRPYGTELRLAQRYFQTSYSGSAVGTATSTNSLYLAAPATGNYQGIQIGLPVSMRTAPTVISYSTTGVSGKFRAAGADVTTTTTNTAINYIFIYASNSAITLCVAANYGGRWDVVQAVKNWQAANPMLNAGQLTQDQLAQHLSTSGMPDVDLLIRTGGEQRISNFLLWQVAYAELYFADILWPDFDVAELNKAVAWFGQRQRRFGFTMEQVSIPEAT